MRGPAKKYLLHENEKIGAFSPNLAQQAFFTHARASLRSFAEAKWAPPMGSDLLFWSLMLIRVRIESCEELTPV